MPLPVRNNPSPVPSEGPMHRPTSRAALAALTLLLAACSGGAGAGPTPTPSGGPTSVPTVSTSPSPSPSPSPSAPANADVAIVRIEQQGGMLPPWETMRWYPTVALYGDGRLITQGPQIELYPGPALPSLLVTHFTQDALDQVLQWAAEAGLAGDDRFLGPPILDAGALVFTVVRPDGTHHTSVRDMSAQDQEIAALREFQDVMTNLRQWLPDDVASDETPYEWQRLRVISFPSDPANLPDPALATAVDWPLDPLATLGASWSEPATYRCFELSDDGLAVVRPIFETANELTLFRSDGVLYQFYLHPLLPDDEACPGF